jgi:hypothetical protein
VPNWVPFHSTSSPPIATLISACNLLWLFSHLNSSSYQNHGFVLWKFSNCLQHQIDHVGKTWLPHNQKFASYHFAGFLVVWPIVSYDLHNMFWTKLDNNFVDLLWRQDIHTLSNNLTYTRTRCLEAWYLPHIRSPHPGCVPYNQQICEKNIIPWQYTIKFMILIPVNPVLESHIIVTPYTGMSSLNFWNCFFISSSFESKYELSIS